MTQSLARAEPLTGSLALNVFGAERVAVLKEQLSRGWPEPMSDAELEHIAMVFQRNRLDPLARPPQIYWIKRLDRRANKYVMTAQLAIDGVRLVAQRSHEYRGQIGPQWTADGQTWLDVWLSDEAPAAARVGVMRKGFAQPVWSVATWKEWAQYEDVWEGPQGNRRKTGRKLTDFWERMGSHMLAKTAEGHALLRAFPQETDGFELAAIDQEWREERAQLAERHAQIFDRESDVVISGDRFVDRQTGEVLAPAPPAAALSAPATPRRSYADVFPEHEEGPSSAQELTEPEPSGAAAAAAPPPSPPVVLADKYRRNRELVKRARELNVAGLSPLKLGQTDDVVDAANLDLEDRIARAEWQQQEEREVGRQKADEGLLLTRHVRLTSPLLHATLTLEDVGGTEMIRAIEDVSMPVQVGWSYWLFQQMLERAIAAAFAGLSDTSRFVQVENLPAPLAAAERV